MEVLKKLEQVQRTLLFVQSRGLIDSSSPRFHDPDANRFLSNLILFLVQPCGKLNMDAKSELISASLSKISTEFLEEAFLFLGEDEQMSLRASEHLPRAEMIDDNAIPVYSDEKVISCSRQTECEEIATVGLDAMLRANSTLEDFCRSYFMFHKMDANKPQSLFRYLPLLSFTESYIYQLDNLNEKLIQFRTSRNPALDGPPDTEENQSRSLKIKEFHKNDPFRPLFILLENRGILTERIKEECKCGEQYWSAERKLCCALTNKTEISVDDVMTAIRLKSFDYRVLNLLLYHLRGEKVNEMHMEFLSISEFLVEVSDDLYDYEDDVLENSFNILRMFVRIYGALAAPTMLAKFVSEAEEKYYRLLKALEPELSMNYQRRCEEATHEGGKKSGPPLGTWNIPPVIEDEDSYRSRNLNISHQLG